MQFKVPQFLDIEDKIFGPFTFREFVYLAGGAGLCFVLFKWLGFWIGLIPIIAIGSLSAALTFYRPNNKPFIFMIQASLGYLTQDKLYIWKKQKVKIDKNKQQNTNPADKIQRDVLESAGRLGKNKLRDLAWSLDVLDLNKQ